MPNYTQQELQTIISRHVNQVRSGAIIGMCLAGISGAIVGWILHSIFRLAGWLA